MGKAVAKKPEMKPVEPVLIVIAAAALVVWRGVQLYKTRVKRRKL
jgi:hypothetical protein